MYAANTSILVCDRPYTSTSGVTNVRFFPSILITLPDTAIERTSEPISHSGSSGTDMAAPDPSAIKSTARRSTNYFGHFIQINMYYTG